MNNQMIETTEEIENICYVCGERTRIIESGPMEGVAEAFCSNECMNYHNRAFN